MTTSNLASGSWCARWGEWQIVLRDSDGRWTVAVWRWPDKAPLSKRTLLGKMTGLLNSGVAIEWASSFIKSLGAWVFVNGKEQSLAQFLSFTPAPEDVS